MIKLSKILLEQSIFDALKSLTTPFKTAISDLGTLGDDDEKTTDDDVRWDRVKNKINEFFGEFPEIVPKTQEQIKDFEAWLKKYRDQLDMNNVKQALTKKYLKTDLNFANEIHKIILNCYKTLGELFKGFNQNQFEELFKEVLKKSAGNIEVAKEKLLHFLLSRASELKKIYSWKKDEGVFDAIVTKFASALQMDKDKVNEIMTKYAKEDPHSKWGDKPIVASLLKIINSVEEEFPDLIGSKMTDGTEMTEEALVDEITKRIGTKQEKQFKNYLMKLILHNKSEGEQQSDEIAEKFYKTLYADDVYADVNTVKNDIEKILKGGLKDENRPKETTEKLKAKRQLVKDVIERTGGEYEGENKKKIDAAVNKTIDDLLQGKEKEFDFERDYDEEFKKIALPKVVELIVNAK